MPIKNKKKKAEYQAVWYRKHKADQLKRVSDRRKRVAEEHKPLLLAYLVKHPCSCGETDPIVLQFDHNDGVEKTNDVARMLYEGYSWKRLLQEIEKCTVRCANCHARRTAHQFGYWKVVRPVGI